MKSEKNSVGSPVLTNTRFIKGVRPEGLMEVLEKNTDKVDGYVSGFDPITFRWLSDRNVYAVVVAEYDESRKGTELRFENYNINTEKDVIDNVVKMYYDSIKEDK